jgi:hypothetical protein
MRRISGALILALAAGAPAALPQPLWPLFVVMAALVAAAALLAVRLRSQILVVWAVLGAAATAAAGVLVRSSSACVWALGLGLVLLAGAELTFAAARPGFAPARLLRWRWEYAAAALSALGLSLIPRLPADEVPWMALLGLAAVGALVTLLALLLARSPR